MRALLNTRKCKYKLRLELKQNVILEQQQLQTVVMAPCNTTAAVELQKMCKE